MTSFGSFSDDNPPDWFIRLEPETSSGYYAWESLGKPPSLAVGSFPDDNPPDCHFFRKTGAGEEIRTLDPNLGNIQIQFRYDPLCFSNIL